MTRVGTFGQHQVLLAEALRQQVRIAETQQQVTTGHKAGDLQGYSREALTLLGSKSLVARTEQYVADNKELEIKLNTYDTAVRSLESGAEALRQDVIKALELGSGTGLMDKVRNLLSQTVGMLNTQLDGKYIFGGTNTGTAPVNVTSAADLIALAEPPTAAFDNNQIRPEVKVDDQVSMAYGMLADEIGLPLMQSLQRILQYDNGTLATPPGPGSAFNNPLTDAQIAFLNGEITQLTTVSRDLTAVAAGNGVRMSELENVQDRQASELTYMKIFVGDVQDVDVAEALSRLNQDELALQASYSVLSQLGRLSLLDFL